MDRSKTVLFVLLGGITAVFVAFWLRRLRRGSGAGAPEPGAEPGPPDRTKLAIGFFTDFLDTLGVGSFATTTALFRFLRQVPDRLIPGTLNVGHTLPTTLQAFVYITLIEVEMTTLAAMIGAAVAGSWLGAGIVAGLPKRQVQIGMGAALLIAASVIVIRLLRSVGLEEGATSLAGSALWLGIAGNFVLGALMTIGVGLYAPCIILVSLLGVQERAAFPIMMGSCAFLMPVASLKFIDKRSYSPRAAAGLTLGGLPAVAIAAWIVTDLDLTTVKWLVVAVVFYTAVTLIYAGCRSESAARNPEVS